MNISDISNPTPNSPIVFYFNRSATERNETAASLGDEMAGFKENIKVTNVHKLQAVDLGMEGWPWKVVFLTIWQDIQTKIWWGFYLDKETQRKIESDAMGRVTTADVLNHCYFANEIYVLNASQYREGLVLLGKLHPKAKTSNFDMESPGEKAPVIVKNLQQPEAPKSNLPEEYKPVQIGM